MFEQLEDHAAKPVVQSWMIWFLLFGLLLIGMMIGILLGRRNWDLLAWAQVMILSLFLWRMALPVWREFKAFRQLKDQRGH